MSEFNQVIEAVHNVMKDVSFVMRDGENDFHGYRYATERQLLQTLRPAMITHGLVMIPSVDEDPVTDSHGNTSIMVTYRLIHTSGQMLPFAIKMPGCGNDISKSGKIGDKGVYKAITGSVKYALFKIFLIPTGDDPEVTNESENDDSPVHAQSPSNSEPEMSTYMKFALSEIEGADSADGLIGFWKSEADRRKALVTAPVDRAHLYDEYLRKGKQLRAMEVNSGKDNLDA